MNSYSSILNYNNVVIIDSGSYSQIISNTPFVIANRIVDTIVLSGSNVYPGQVYSQVGNNFMLSSISSDELAECIFVVESCITSGSNSIATVVYKGYINFTNASGITLTPGCPYFLSSADSGLLGSSNVRNLTINEPLTSKPIYIANSSSSAIVINMRGVQNNSQPYINLPNNVLDLPCGNVLVDPSNPIFQSHL